MNTTDPSFPVFFPASWASEWGEDRRGLFMVLDVNGVMQRFRWIAPGEFLMGSTEHEEETPHPVTLTQGYWLADTACTQALWQAVMGNNPAQFQDDKNNPVENVSWHDAQLFFEKINQLFPELKAQLPTEAQWEYACRAGTKTAFSFGDTISPEQVNYNGNYPYKDGAKGVYRQKTVPVKSLPVNPYGLYEMHGNVWEWCLDWYGDYPAEAVVDPVGVDTGSDRVLRGGSWISIGGFTRSAYRDGRDPAYSISSTGFRLALG